MATAVARGPYRRCVHFPAGLRESALAPASLNGTSTHRPRTSSAAGGLLRVTGDGRGLRERSGDAVPDDRREPDVEVELGVDAGRVGRSTGHAVPPWSLVQSPACHRSARYASRTAPRTEITQYRPVATAPELRQIQTRPRTPDLRAHPAGPRRVAPLVRRCRGKETRRPAPASGTTKRKQSSEAGADRISSRPQVSRGSLSRPQPRPRRRSAMSTERQRASHGSGTRRCRAGPRARRAARRGARGQ